MRGQQSRADQSAVVAEAGADDSNASACWIEGLGRGGEVRSLDPVRVGGCDRSTDHDQTGVERVGEIHCRGGDCCTGGLEHLDCGRIPVVRGGGDILSSDQAVIEHDRTTDAGGEREVHEVVGSASCSVPPFGEGGSIGVPVDHDRNVERVRQFVAEGEPSEPVTRVRRSEDRSRCRIDGPGDAHADPRQRCFGCGLPDQVDAARHDVRTGTIGFGTSTRSAHNDAGLIHRGCPDPRAAELGALIMKEAAQVAAISMDAAEFRHGPLELAGPGLSVVVVAIEEAVRDLDERLVADLASAGSPVIVVGPVGLGARYHLPTESVDPLFDVIQAGVPLQLMTWAIAAERHEVPGVFRVGAKVTVSE